MSRMRRDEEGQLSAFVAILVLPLVAVAGLVYDGGSVMAAHQEAITEAFQAARAGAQALDANALRQAGTVVVDPVAARSAALAYLSAVGRTGTVSVTGAEVTVKVSFPHPLAILSALGVRPVTVSGTASASAVRGVTEAGQ